MESIQLSHGAGGEAMWELIKVLILPAFKLKRIEDGVGLEDLDDASTIPLGDLEVVISIDSHTVEPLFFPGGDIGRLAVAGSVNDVAVMGAKPLAIVDALVVEEGFPVKDLERIIDSMSGTAEEAGVALLGGDFKVMPRGKVDGVVVTTAAIGVAPRGRTLKDNRLQAGDVIIVSGPIGDHGIAIASVREGISFETPLTSDVMPIADLMEEALKAGRVRTAKDPTRGGLAATLNELASKAGVSIWIREEDIPIRPEVRAAAEMLGLDPLELSCEGRVVLAVDKEDADRVLQALRRHPKGREASIIGEVKAERPGYVVMETLVGGLRVVNMPIGEPTPRVC